MSWSRSSVPRVFFSAVFLFAPLGTARADFSSSASWASRSAFLAAASAFFSSASSLQKCQKWRCQRWMRQVAKEKDRIGYIAPTSSHCSLRLCSILCLLVPLREHWRLPASAPQHRLSVGGRLVEYWEMRSKIRSWYALWHYRRLSCCSRLSVLACLRRLLYK